MTLFSKNKWSSYKDVIRRSPTMNVVSNVIVFYVVFCAKKYMSSFLTFQIYHYKLWLCVSRQSNVGNVYSYYVAYDVQLI